MLPSVAADWKPFHTMRAYDFRVGFRKKQLSGLMEVKYVHSICGSVMALSDTEFTLICRARRRLCDLSDPSPTVASIARESGISPFHFIRRFEAIFGSTPHQYRIQARLSEARLRLATGSSVTDACLAAGFESVGSFSELFVRHVGIRPVEYRKLTRVSVTVPFSLAPAYFPGCLSLMRNLPAETFRNFRDASALSTR